MKDWLAAAAGAMALSGTIAYSAAGQSPPAPTAPQREARRPIDPARDVRNFLAAKGRQQSSAIEQLRAAGVPYGQVRSLVARYASLLRSNRLVGGAGLAAEVNEAFLTDIAIELAFLGYGPRDLQDADAARALFLAAAAKRRAAASSAQLMQLAPTAVVARVDGYAMSAPSGASPAEMRVTAIRSLKGDVGSDAAVRVLLRTRRNADGTVTRPTDEYLPPIGSEVLLMLSSSAARLQGRAARGADAQFAKIAEPYRVTGGTAVPVIEQGEPIPVAR